MYSIKTQDKRASADTNITCEQLGDLSSNIRDTMATYARRQCRNINLFHRQVQLIFEQRARILFGFVLFFCIHCKALQWEQMGTCSFTVQKQKQEQQGC